MKKKQNSNEDKLEAIIDLLFPSIISEQNFSNTKLFIEKLENLKEFANKKTNSLLSKETLRYQSIIFYLSIIFLLIASLKLDSIKIFGNLITIDENSLIILLFAFLSIIIIFIIKAVIDIKTNNIGILFEGINVHRLRNFLEKRTAKIHIDTYYKTEIINMIGIKYKEINSLVLKHINGTQTNLYSDDFFKNIIDISPLKKDGYLNNYIEERESIFKQISSMLESDAKYCKDKINSHFQTYTDPNNEFVKFTEIESLKNETMGKWFRIQKELGSSDYFTISDFLEGKDPAHIKEMKSFIKVLKSTNKIRRWLIFFEIILPILFAGGILVYYFIFSIS